MLCIWFGNADVGSGTPSPVESTVKPVTCGPIVDLGAGAVPADPLRLAADAEPADDALAALVGALLRRPGRVQEKKLVTSRRLLFFETARPRGWKWRDAVRVVAAAALQVDVPDHPALAARLGPVDHGDRVLAAVGDVHAPAVRARRRRSTAPSRSRSAPSCPARRSALARNLRALARVIRITVTDPDAALATYA